MDRMDWCEYWEMLDLSILMGESVFKWMSCKEYFALDKDIGDYSNQGTRKVYDYQLHLLALKLCRRQQRTSTLHSPAFQWEVLQTRFDITIMDSYQGYGTQQSNTEDFHGCEHKVKTIIVNHLKDIKASNTVKWCKQRH